MSMTAECCPQAQIGPWDRLTQTMWASAIEAEQFNSCGSFGLRC